MKVEVKEKDRPVKGEEGGDEGAGAGAPLGVVRTVGEV